MLHVSIFKNPQLRNIKYLRSEGRCTSMFQMDIKIPRIYVYGNVMLFFLTEFNLKLVMKKFK